VKACPLCAEAMPDDALVCPWCDAQATPDGWRVATYAGPGVRLRAGTNGLAIASFVCGLLFFLWFVPSILAVVFGHLARRQLRDAGGHQRGAGLATAGLVLGWLGMAAVAVIVVVLVIDAAGSEAGR
jgi:hypothetical protein